MITHAVSTKSWGYISSDVLTHQETLFVVCGLIFRLSEVGEIASQNIYEEDILKTRNT